jgi:hypothetical protein
MTDTEKLSALKEKFPSEFALLEDSNMRNTMAVASIMNKVISLEHDLAHITQCVQQRDVRITFLNGQIDQLRSVIKEKADESRRKVRPRKRR